MIEADMNRVKNMGTHFDNGTHTHTQTLNTHVHALSKTWTRREGHVRRAHRYLQVLYSKPTVIAAARGLLWQKAVRSTALRAPSGGNLEGEQRALKL